VEQLRTARCRRNRATMSELSMMFFVNKSAADVKTSSDGANNYGLQCRPLSRRHRTLVTGEGSVPCAARHPSSKNSPRNLLPLPNKSLRVARVRSGSRVRRDPLYFSDALRGKKGTRVARRRHRSLT